MFQTSHDDFTELDGSERTTRIKMCILAGEKNTRMPESDRRARFHAERARFHALRGDDDRAIRHLRKSAFGGLIKVDETLGLTDTQLKELDKISGCNTKLDRKSENSTEACNHKNAKWVDNLWCYLEHMRENRGPDAQLKMQACVDAPPPPGPWVPPDGSRTVKPLPVEFPKQQKESQHKGNKPGVLAQFVSNKILKAVGLDTPPRKRVK